MLSMGQLIQALRRKGSEARFARSMFSLQNSASWHEASLPPPPARAWDYPSRPPPQGDSAADSQSSLIFRREQTRPTKNCSNEAGQNYPNKRRWAGSCMQRRVALILGNGKYAIALHQRLRGTNVAALSVALFPHGDAAVPNADHCVDLLSPSQVIERLNSPGITHVVWVAITI